MRGCMIDVVKVHSVRGDTIVILSVNSVRSKDMQNRLLQQGTKTGRKSN